jgi:hypothetical protein
MECQEGPDRPAPQGLALAPPLRAIRSSPDRWSREAFELELVTHTPRPGEAPGRWRREALLGLITPQLANPLRELSSARQIFAHRYTRAGDDEHGRDVWASVQSLVSISPRVSADIERALERLWPHA